MSDTKAPEETPQSSPSGGGPLRARAARASLADMLIGTVLADRYKLLRRIGEGAMGWVFLAEHTEIGKRCAVKVLRPSLCKLPEAVRRFRREARAASQIGSRHIVDITDFGTTPNGAVFFVMEHLGGGEDLGSAIKREGKLSWERVVHMTKQLCDALQAAHDAEIIHRDCKPANFYRISHEGTDDFIKVLDFGIARLATPKDSIVTATGVIMGTPDFMAPEQAQGKHVDHRADIYSLGASAYAMLTGRPPFVGANEYDVIYKQLNEDPKPPSELNPGGRIPPWLDAALLKAMAKDPQERYQTMREFGAALEASAVMEQPTSTRSGSQVRPAAQRSNIPVSPAVIVAAVVALALIGALATYLFVLD